MKAVAATARLAGAAATRRDMLAAASPVRRGSKRKPSPAAADTADCSRAGAGWKRGRRVLEDDE